VKGESARAALYFAGLILVALFPLLVLAGYVLAPGWSYPSLFPRETDPRALEYVVSQAWPIARHLGSSMIYSLLTVLLTFALCLAPAHHLSRRRFACKSLVEGLLLAPALAPAMTFSMGVHFAFLKTGLADTLPGVVLALTTFSYPYMLRALVAGYQSFGEEYDLCARNLGAGVWTRFWRVDFPLLVPGAVAGGTVVFLVAFSEYFLVFLIGGGRVPSFTGYLFPLLTSSDRSVASALTLLFLLVPLGLFVLVELAVTARYRARGLA
jgi:ABC-type spermidine/putrescine transport system permease subunit II